MRIINEPRWPRRDLPGAVEDDLCDSMSFFIGAHKVATVGRVQEPSATTATVLRCDNCGAPLPASGDRNEVACEYCGGVSRIVRGQTAPQSVAKKPIYLGDSQKMGRGGSYSDIVDAIELRAVFMNELHCTDFE